MKTLMIVCGSGIATSTLAEGKIKSYLEDKGLASQVKMMKGNIAEQVNHVDDYDAFVSTTIVPENIRDHVISGVPLLTGVNQDKVFEQIVEKLDLK
ncbi:PTS sugar transporter subunit IIB [Paucilactobacillus wasatchensis]|uniref:PTS system, galactitol-specific IIB component n=1 Tax=Paucilactobacillus wasatchensis TaxID=1335616 RepID=A0A0D1A973_9LACO|nr:PTS sugar transporter subunit IIB [Paucilactobacillus wasatchensis]KIS03301.1 PTS system, galactitol-specific IIB component [Paucilactobacillus wasatchensis]